MGYINKLIRTIKEIKIFDSLRLMVLCQDLVQVKMRNFSSF